MTPTHAGTPCKRGHDGTRYADGGCVECARAAGAAYRLANREKVKAHAAAWYLANPDRTRASAAYRLANPERVKANNAARYLANPEKHRARGAAYRLANPERVRTRHAAYCKANPEQVKARRAAWAKANPAICAAQWARRKARKLAAPGRGVTAAQWRQVLADSLGLCVYCNERKPLAMDHIEPLRWGGAHDIDNIAAACQSCNSSKNDTSLLVWLARRAA